MIRRAEERGDIRPGDTLIEATSGNTGIALAMAAAIKGYRMLLIMPEDLSIERAQTMKAFGAELILTPKAGGMEHALVTWPSRCSATAVAGVPRPVRQRRQPARALRDHRPRDLGADTAGRVTHFVSAMGTTGTITGVSRYLKEQNPAVRIIGAQPQDGSRIPGIRKWPEAYLPKIYDPSGVDELIYVSQGDAEDMARRLARDEGLFAGISAAGACWAALQIAQQVENAHHRLHRLRPGRPLPFHRGFPGLRCQPGFRQPSMTPPPPLSGQAGPQHADSRAGAALTAMWSKAARASQLAFSLGLRAGCGRAQARQRQHRLIGPRHECRPVPEQQRRRRPPCH